jgi:hypothetical protein
METTNISTSAKIAPEVGTTLVNATPAKIIMPQRFSHIAKGQSSSQPAVLAGLQQQMANLKYPVASQADLMSRFGTEGKLSLEGKMIDLKTATAKIPASFFPIKSAEDFEAKVSQSLAKVGQSLQPRPIIKLNHPTSVTKQAK